MEITEFQHEIFQQGKEIGFSEMEIYFSSSKAISISVHKHEIDEYTIVEQGGVSLRGLFNGQMGYAYAEKVDLDSISLLLEEAMSNARVIEVEDSEDLFEGSDEYAAPRPFSESLAEIEASQLIEAAFEMEKTALELDDRIENVNYCGVSKVVSESLIANTKGLLCQSKSSYVSAEIYLQASEGTSMATGGKSDFTFVKFSDLNFKEIAKKGVEETVSKLHAESLETGDYPVILRYDTATDLLGSYLGLFSAESVQKGYSKFKGKLNEQVAGDNITLVDDPTMTGVVGYASFDSEGYRTKRKEIIKNGQLLTFMHNRKTAKKDGIESTGNAVKGGYRGTLGVGPYNVYLDPGESSLNEMIEKMDKGIMLVELQGMNAGINGVAGDFSVAAIGFLIENGKITRPVDQITVAGNFFDILHNIEEIGNDLDFRGSVTIPSLKIKQLSFSGNIQS
ncbi:TldD/PmbA family protein [Psychrobacillus sp. L4]|uniref:TldD/PmbA family protein n=1 Tax=Psychrobacillus sp. L4 TaxID=3236892 RepID=UPI0036F43118